MSIHKQIKRITTHVLIAMKQRQEKISMLTAYDYSMARILDAAGIEIPYPHQVEIQKQE